MEPDIATYRDSESPTPHGVGGLKSINMDQVVQTSKSHPSRGGWIEIRIISTMEIVPIRPTPHGVGGLK